MTPKPQWLRTLFLVLARKRRVPHGAAPFGYTKGTMAFPVAIVVASLVELGVVHVLVPWTWLQILLLVLTIWGILLVLGPFASRAVHPHLVTSEALELRWGHRSVLSTPLTNLRSVEPLLDHAPTQPAADGTRLILTQFQSTNVRIVFVEPVASSPPVPRRHLPPGFRAAEAALYVDDPTAFIAACER